MKRSLSVYLTGFLLALLFILAAVAAVVYLCDPCFYYRLPEEGEGIYFSERYQSAGLARNGNADTVVLGSSMAANYRKSHIESVFGGTGLRITIPDGYLSEFDQVMNVLFRAKSPQRVLFALDLNILVRDESGLTSAMPDYLYDDDPVNDLKYLLNKDMLYYSGYAMLARGWGEGQTLDEGFTWDEGIWWNHMTALSGYTRPEIAEEALAEDAYRENVAANLAVITAWAESHPETEFHVFLSPYSILFWDKCQRLGETEARLAALEQVCKTLTGYENLHLYGYLFDTDIVEDLDNYCDHIHHSGDVADRILQGIAAGEGELTAETWPAVLDAWREHLADFDFEKYWTDSYWYAWNYQHSEPAA